ncbi:hypothetical protein BU17DRAFT_63484 [Hysterangium stoloniferum]|nr:hypothetical protein BU17DRAFT_63484 [Hysterangium stoloniferum]
MKTSLPPPSLNDIYLRMGALCSAPILRLCFPWSGTNLKRILDFLSEGKLTSASGTKNLQYSSVFKCPTSHSHGLQLTLLPDMSIQEGKCQNAGVSKNASKCASKGFLPQELVDEIVDYISHDNPTLLACHITCHTWAMSAKRYLFKELAISRSSGENFTRLTERNSSAPQSVQILTIVRDKEEPISVQMTMIPRLRQGIRLRLPTFRLLFSSESLYTMTWNHTLQNFTSVRRLCVQFINFASLEDLVDLVIAVPTATELELWQVNVPRSSSTVSQGLAKRTMRRIRSILDRKDRSDSERAASQSLAGVTKVGLPVIALHQLECASAFSATIMFTHTLMMRAILAIDTLVFYCFRREDGLSISSVLKNIGTSLKHLEMRLVATYQEDTEACVRSHRSHHRHVIQHGAMYLDPSLHAYAIRVIIDRGHIIDGSVAQSASDLF